MKVFLILAIAFCAYAADVKEKDNESEQQQNKDKRQTQDEIVSQHFIFRLPRKQEPIPVEETQEEEKDQTSRSAAEEYRPGQVFSLNVQELLQLQPERKAPLASGHQLQQLYTDTQPEHKQNLQFYYLEPQSSRQVQIQPSHAVIARPSYTSNGGEASVGAALSVSDTGASSSEAFDQELLALIGQPAGQDRQYTQSQQAYSPAPQVTQPQHSFAQQGYSQSQLQQITSQNVAPQYQQVERYITKPSKKPTKLRPKVQIAPPQSPNAPQQYLIETTNVQHQAQPTTQPQYRPAPQPQRQAQAQRYLPIQQAQAPIQQLYYPEAQGLKVVAPPKLAPQQPRAQAQLTYRIVPQYQQEANPKQYRIVEAPRQQQPVRLEQQRVPAASERPVSYLKRFPEPEQQMRTVKLYDQTILDKLAPTQPAQIIGEQYYLRPVYRTENQRGRYEPIGSVEHYRVAEPTKAPHSAIYVSKNVAPKKVSRPQPQQEQVREANLKHSQSLRYEQINSEQQQIDEQRSHLPPPKNNKAYTPEEFAALVAAGYSVTPIPVSSHSAQARSSGEVASAPAPLPRRPQYSRRHQYLPLRSDDAP